METRPVNASLVTPKLVLPQQPALSQRSLQVNVNSLDDAKAVIQHLGKLKQVYELTSCQSVEFCIAQEVKEKVEKTLSGAINWCRTYVKIVAPFDGNILFQLPHYIPPAVCNPPFTQDTSAPQVPPSTHGKSKRPVPATELVLDAKS